MIASTTAPQAAHGAVMPEKKREMTMFKVYKDTLKQVRLRAVQEEIQMQEWIEEALKDALKKPAKKR